MTKDLKYIIPGMVLGGLGNGPAFIASLPELLAYGRTVPNKGTT